MAKDPGALTALTISQIATSVTRMVASTMLARWRMTGSAASTGPRGAWVVVLIGGSPVSGCPAPLGRRDEVGRRGDDLVRLQLAVLGGVDRHRVRVRVAVLVDGERAEDAVGDLGLEQLRHDAGAGAVAGRDGREQHLGGLRRVRGVRLDPAEALGLGEAGDELLAGALQVLRRRARHGHVHALGVLGPGRAGAGNG